jgi:peptidoglycan/xylan/chitin deacetylase (PgdA/CDA1 family)
MSLNNFSLVMMYHYVLPEKEQNSRKGIVSLNPKEFERQLDFLEDNFEIINPQQFIQLKQTKKPKCLLTFDDGTKDHFNVIFPILKKRGLKGVFFVLTGPLEGYYPTAFLIHELLGLLSEHVFLKKLEAHIKTLGLTHILKPNLKQHPYIYEHIKERRTIKYLLNFGLTRDLAREFVIQELEKFSFNIHTELKKRFLVREEILKMQAEGMVIGNHGHYHQSLPTMDKDMIELEIMASHYHLKDLLKLSPSWYVLPFGGQLGEFEKLNLVIRKIKQLGYIAATTTTQTLNFGNFNHYQINRIDASSMKNVTTMSDIFNLLSSPL